MYELAFCGDCGSERQTEFCTACGAPSTAKLPMKASPISPLGMSAASQEVDDAQQARWRIFAFTLLSLLMIAAAFLIGNSMNSDMPSEDARDQQPAVTETNSTPSVSQAAESARTCRIFLEVWAQILVTNTVEAVELNGFTVYRNLDLIVRGYNTEEIPVEGVRDAWLASLDSDSAATSARFLDAVRAVDSACEPHGVDLGLK